MEMDHSDDGPVDDPQDEQSVGDADAFEFAILGGKGVWEKTLKEKKSALPRRWRWKNPVKSRRSFCLL